MIVDFLSPTDNHAVSRFPDINTYPLACLFSVGKGTSYISARHTEIFPRNEANEKIRMEFKNDRGEKLAGLLELPDRIEDISNFALFAHCFTCSKDIAPASRISRALAARCIGVLRFDFTGLANNDGDFANTNFSSNIDDLIHGAKALESKYRAP